MTDVKRGEGCINEREKISNLEKRVELLEREVRMLRSQMQDYQQEKVVETSTKQTLTYKPEPPRTQHEPIKQPNMFVSLSDGLRQACFSITENERRIKVAKHSARLAGRCRHVVHFNNV